jgi:hypothetical protein
VQEITISSKMREVYQPTENASEAHQWTAARLLRNIRLDQGSQTQILSRAALAIKNVPRAAH